MTELVLSRTVAERRFTLLLGALAGLLIAAPLFGETPRGHSELGLLFSVLVIGFVLAAERLRILALVLACVWFGYTWTGNGASVIADISLLALCIVTIDSVLAHALSARRVDTEVLAAAISAYVLMGIGWAVIFTMLETFSPGSLHLTDHTGEDPWNTILYFSFATLTTLGYGDVAPLSLTARAWATIEAMGGTLYLAILIARLVSLYKADPEATKSTR